MAARAMWKGILQLGPASVPVKLYSAVEDRTVHFNLLEAKTHARVKQHMVDPETGREVPKEEIRRAYQLEPGAAVVLKQDELDKLEPEPSRDIDLLTFVPPEAIVHQWYDRPYYLGPDGDDVGYFALAEALQRQGREGVARWVMRKKQYVGALRARDRYLVLIKLRYADEVLTAQELPAPSGRPLDEREVKMAEQLVGMLEGEFQAEDYIDEYRERVMRYIEAKAQGAAPKLPKIPAKRQEGSLTDVLSASLQAARRGGKVA
jgi:DNA end-binding protein Ku